MNINVKEFVKPVLAFTKKNAPQILSGLSVVTGGLAVISAAKNRDKHVELRNEKITEEHDKLTIAEELECGVKAYWSTGLIFIGSCALSFAANKSYIEKLATMYAAVKLSEKELSGLETAVEKTFGESGLEKAEDTKSKDIALEASRTFDESKIVDTGLGREIFLDPKTGTLFYCSYEKVKGAFLEIEAALKDEDQCLNDFRYKVNLDPCEFGEGYAFGWKMGTSTQFRICPTRDENRFGGRVVNVLNYKVHMSDFIDAYDEF